MRGCESQGGVKLLPKGRSPKGRGWEWGFGEGAGSPGKFEIWCNLWPQKSLQKYEIMYRLYTNDYMLTLLKGCRQCTARGCLQMWGVHTPYVGADKALAESRLHVDVATAADVSFVRDSLHASKQFLHVLIYLIYDLSKRCPSATCN